MSLPNRGDAYLESPPWYRVPSKGSLALILPTAWVPLTGPFTGPRTAMPFDRHMVPGLLLHVDIERRLEVPAETRGHP